MWELRKSNEEPSGFHIGFRAQGFLWVRDYGLGSRVRSVMGCQDGGHRGPSGSLV